MELLGFQNQENKQFHTFPYIIDSIIISILFIICIVGL